LREQRALAAANTNFWGGRDVKANQVIGIASICVKRNEAFMMEVTIEISCEGCEISMKENAAAVGLTVIILRIATACSWGNQAMMEVAIPERAFAEKYLSFRKACENSSYFQHYLNMRENEGSSLLSACYYACLCLYTCPAHCLFLPAYLYCGCCGMEAWKELSSPILKRRIFALCKVCAVDWATVPEEEKAPA